MAVRSTVGDSLISGLSLAMGSRAKDEERAGKNLLRQKQLQQADVDLDRSKVDLDRARVGLTKDQADAHTSLIQAAYARPQAEADLLSTEASTKKTLAETEGQNISNEKGRLENRNTAIEQFRTARANAAEETVDMMINANPDAIGFDNQGRLQLDTRSILEKTPELAVQLFNTSNIQWMRSVDENGNLSQNDLVGFAASEDPTTGETVYTPLLRNKKGQGSAPATVNGTSDPNDPVIRLSESQLNAQINQAFISSWTYGGRNSKAAVAEIGRRGGNAWIDNQPQREEIVAVADRIKDSVTDDLPLPEAQRRGLINIVDTAIAAGDMSTLRAIAEDTKTDLTDVLSRAAIKSGLGTEFSDELYRQKTEAENQYLDKRIDSKNPRYITDKLSFDLSNQVDDASGVYTPQQLEEKSAALKEKNRGILRQRMTEAKQSFPAFEKDYAKLAAVIASGIKVVGPEEEKQVREGFAKYGELTPETFQKIVKEEPNLAALGLSFFAQGSEDPLATLQEGRNLALRGATDYKADTKADDTRLDAELSFSKYKEAVRQGERFQDRIEEVSEALQKNADTVLGLLADPNFDMTDLRDEQQKEFIPAIRALLTRANAQGKLLSDMDKSVVQDVKGRALFEVMQNQGSLGLKGWLADTFYRSNAPVQLGNLMDKLVVSTDGSKIGVYDTGGGDVVFKGEVSFSQIADMFNEQIARELIKNLPKKRF